MRSQAGLGDGLRRNRRGLSSALGKARSFLSERNSRIGKSDERKRRAVALAAIETQAPVADRNCGGRDLHRAMHLSRNRKNFIMNLAKLFGAILVAVNLAWSAKGALPLTALYSFPAGETSNAGLIEDTNGNFFGTTATGGANNDGTVFKLSPAGMLTTLIQFNGANGAAPYAPLIEDRSGNLYGTASSGGFRTNGTVFKISPAGVLSLLAVFNGTNGATPDGPLAQGTNGYFYGTTFGGGSNRAGTIFQ